MIFRIYHETRGGHVHCRLFAGQHDGALGKCGDMCFRVEEFTEFIGRFAYIDLRREGDGPIVQQIMEDYIDPKLLSAYKDGRK